MNLFFDTSALVKIFHDESGSVEMRHLYFDVLNTSYIPDITQIEYYCDLYRCFRNKELTKAKLEIAKEDFEREITNIFIQSTSTFIIEEARSLLSIYGESKCLRTLDSLDLASFLVMSENNWIFVFCDNIISKVEEFADYRVFNPLKNNMILS